MFLARIEGTLTSTAKHKSFQNQRLLIGQRVNADYQPEGDPQIIMDNIGAGYGSLVMVSTDGDHARRVTNDKSTPSRLVVIGIVDEVSR